MYLDYTAFALKDREIREQGLSERIAESRRLALGTSWGPYQRARMARRLFALAVAADRKETWKVVWGERKDGTSRINLEHAIAERNRVMERWTIRGTVGGVEL